MDHTKLAEMAEKVELALDQFHAIEAHGLQAADFTSFAICPPEQPIWHPQGSRSSIAWRCILALIWPIADGSPDPFLRDMALSRYAGRKSGYGIMVESRITAMVLSAAMLT